MTLPANTLQGLKIMVTRPQQLANHLVGLIEGKGGQTFLYPVITILGPGDTEQLEKTLKQLSDFDIAIFISPTAVSKTLERINTLPVGIDVAAIGSSTVAALHNAAIKVAIKPQGHDSEALLQHQQLQTENLRGKKVVIFRGQGGRELLGNTLASRGATVSYAEMYRRIRNDKLPPLTTDNLKSVNIIAITSNEGLQNLYDLAADKTTLLDTPLLVPGSRSRSFAETLGFRTIIRSENATDEACIKALEHWAA